VAGWPCFATGGGIGPRERAAGVVGGGNFFDESEGPLWSFVRRSALGVLEWWPRV
jgi:hypothetical protein